MTYRLFLEHDSLNQYDHEGVSEIFQDFYFQMVDEHWNYELWVAAWMYPEIGTAWRDDEEYHPESGIGQHFYSYLALHLHQALYHAGKKRKCIKVLSNNPVLNGWNIHNVKRVAVCRWWNSKAVIKREIGLTEPV